MKKRCIFIFQRMITQELIQMYLSICMLFYFCSNRKKAFIKFKYFSVIVSEVI